MGLYSSKHWGLVKSTMGKAILFLSLGLITWGIGEMIWSGYNFFLKVDVPYPSLADVGFVISWPLWGIGLYYLSFATGAKFGLKKLTGKFQLLMIPLIAIAFSYFLLVVVARDGVLTSNQDWIKVFFDLIYPFFDVLILTEAAIIYGLSFKYIGGKYKWPVLVILLGVVVNYFADFGFSYTTTIETFYNGSWVDLLFSTAMFLVSFGVNNFSTES